MYDSSPLPLTAILEKKGLDILGGDEKAETT
jgi:hypothetical protein